MPISILYIAGESDVERLIRSKYRRHVDAEEFTCDFARSGSEAQALVDERREPYELIFVDISLDETNSVQMLDALAGRAGDTPILIVSDRQQVANIRASMNRGAIDFLPRPENMEELAFTRREALRHFETLRAPTMERDHGGSEIAALGLLVAGVAHDLKNPLGFISSFIKLALEQLGEIDEEIVSRSRPEFTDEFRADLDSLQQTLKKVASHGELALQLVRTLLASGGGNESFDFNAVVALHVNLFESSIKARYPELGLVLHKHFDDSIGSVVLDPRGVLSVVVNLLENAFHALREVAAPSSDFKPVVWVETRALDGAVELSVSDNGPGVPVSLREQIFQPFFTTKGPGEGVGLGLHQVERIAAEAGGKVLLEDRSPSGACFRVRFAG